MYPSLPGLLATLWVWPYYTDKRNETGAEKPFVWSDVFTEGQSLSGPKHRALDSEEKLAMCHFRHEYMCLFVCPLSTFHADSGVCGRCWWVGGLTGREKGDADPLSTCLGIPLPPDPGGWGLGGDPERFSGLLKGEPGPNCRAIPGCSICTVCGV